MMDIIATYLRFLQLYAHNAHNMIQGPMFFEYHDFLGELYPVYESAYDSVIERALGLGIELDLKKITSEANYLIETKPFEVKEPLKLFAHILDCEKILCNLIGQSFDQATIGSQQLLGDIADKSEGRQYKIKQLLKGLLHGEAAK